jgi:hypothetical protein
MQISARSCLAAGISLTTATAIALAPIAVPANERAVTVPSVTVSDIQLTVTPGEVTAFFLDLQEHLAEFNAAVAQAAIIPGQTVVEALHSAIALNDQLFDTLVSSTDNLTLQALFQTLQLAGDNGLGALAAAVGNANDTVVVSTTEIADLLGAIVNGSLANALAAVVRVVNDPLVFSNYARALAAGVASGTLVANNGGRVIRNVGHIGFELAYTGIDLVQAEINNAINSIRGLINVGAQATGSPLIQAVMAAAQAITIAPLQLGIILPFALSNDVLGGLENGFNAVLDGLIGTLDGPDGDYIPGIFSTAGTALSLAIRAVGADPLSVLSYAGAAGLLTAGGFDVFNKTVDTVAAVAKVPFDVGVNIFDPDEESPSLTNVIIRLNNQIASALAGLLQAVGLPENVATLPLAFAGQVNDVIRAGAGAVVGGLDGAIDLIDNGAAVVVDVSHTIENVILGTGSGEAPTAPETPSEPSPSASAPAVDVTSDEEEITEDVAPEAISTDDKAPAQQDDAPSDDEDADDAAADDESQNTGGYTSRSRDRRAEREAEKQDTSASDSSSDNGSDSADGAAA